MFNQYFGQYLFNQGILTAEQLTEVLTHERAVRLKLGVLAVNAGIMTASQVEQVHDLQRTKDKRFGELAIEQGYLTLKQMEELLEVQQRRQLTLSQAIVDLGYLNLSELEQVLIKFKEQSGLAAQQWQSLQVSDYNDISQALLDFFSAGAMGEVYHKYVALLLRNIIRFLNEDPLLMNADALDSVVLDRLVSQAVYGEMELFTGLTADEATLLGIARRYSGEELMVLDDLALDSVAEFLNVINGIFCVNASDQGVDLDLQPQQILREEKLSLRKGYRISIRLSFGKLNLILAAGKL